MNPTFYIFLTKNTQPLTDKLNLGLTYTLFKFRQNSRTNFQVLDLKKPKLAWVRRYKTIVYVKLKLFSSMHIFDEWQTEGINNLCSRFQSISMQKYICKCMSLNIIL